MNEYQKTAFLCLKNAARVERGETLNDSATRWRKRAAAYLRKAAQHG